MNKQMIGALTGVGFILVLAASFIVMGEEPPEAKDGAQKIAEHYTDNKDDIQISAVIGTLAGALLVFFGGYLRKVLSAAGDANSTLPPLVVAGAAIIATGAAIDSTLSFAMAEAADDIDGSQLQTLQALWDNDFLPFALGSVVFWVAAGLSIVRSGALPKWLGWVAIVIGVLSCSPIFFVGLGLGALWILVASVMLALRARSATA